MLCAGIITWEKELANQRIVVHCDNQAVVCMVNSLSSKCPKCMLLLRILTLNGLIHNRRVSTVYIRSTDNKLSDTLSRLDFPRFWREGPNMNPFPDQVNEKMKSAMKLFNLQISI